MQPTRVGVIGAGTMGNGISQALAAAGLEAIMTDIAEAPLDKAMATIAASLDRLVKKATLPPGDKEKILARIRTATDLAALKDCDLVIEAATENLELKLKIFAQLDQQLPAAIPIAPGSRRRPSARRR